MYFLAISSTRALDVPGEGPAERPPALFLRLGEEAAEVLERKLRVHRDDALADARPPRPPARRCGSRAGARSARAGASGRAARRGASRRGRRAPSGTSATCSRPWMSRPTSTTRCVASPSLPRLPCTSPTTRAARSSRSPTAALASWMRRMPSWSCRAHLAAQRPGPPPPRRRAARSSSTFTRRRSARRPRRAARPGPPAPSARTASSWRWRAADEAAPCRSRARAAPRLPSRARSAHATAIRTTRSAPARRQEVGSRAAPPPVAADRAEPARRAHDRASRRPRQSPDMRLWQSAKSYFTGSLGVERGEARRDLLGHLPVRGSGAA